MNKQPIPDNFITHLINLKSAYLAEHKRSPKELHISIVDEHELVKCLDSLGKDIASKAVESSIRIALPRLHGVPIVYGANETAYK